MHEMETVWTGASWRHLQAPVLAPPKQAVVIRMEEKRARVLKALKGGHRRTRLALEDATSLTRDQVSDTLALLIREKQVMRYGVHRGPALYQRLR